MKKHILLFSLLAFCLAACEEESVGQYPTDSEAPGSVSNVVVKEVFGGGVTLSYTIPDDPDLQGVMAEYTLDTGEKISTIVSGYAREITIEGFATATEHEATLRAVERASNTKVE